MRLNNKPHFSLKINYIAQKLFQGCGIINMTGRLERLENCHCSICLVNYELVTHQHD